MPQNRSRTGSEKRGRAADLSECRHGAADVIQVCDWTLQPLCKPIDKQEDAVHVRRRLAVEGGAESSFPQATLVSERHLQLIGVKDDRADCVERRQLCDLQLQLLQEWRGIMGI